jgi:HEPN domain-containing protein
MTAQADIAKHVRGWVEKAEHDRTNAVHTLTLETRCPFDTACYHAQQCAEKYLKAQLVLLGRDFPKTHDLGVLVALLPGTAGDVICISQNSR